MTEADRFDADPPSRAAPKTIAGSFYYDLPAGRAVWSDVIYEILGYRCGDIPPTMETTLAHIHPEDRPAIRTLVDKTIQGGRFSSYYRIIDAEQREHRVLITATALRDTSGNVRVIEGQLVDLTGRMQKEATERGAAKWAASRGTIDCAKGYLMCFFTISADEAFSLLVSRSQYLNKTLLAVASDLLTAAETGGGSRAAQAFRGTEKRRR